MHDDRNDGVDGCPSAPRQGEVPTDTFASMWSGEVADLRRYCVRQLRGNVAEADEAVARVAIRAVQHFTPAIRNHRAWLRSIARNACIDLHRERDRAPAASVDAFDETGERGDLPKSCDNPESAFIDRETRHSLHRAVQELPPALIDLVKLHYFDEVPFTDIARITGMSESNVRRRIAEAHDLLRVDLRRAPQAALQPRTRRERRSTFGVGIPARVEAVRHVHAFTSDGRELELDLFLTYIPRRYSVRTLDALRRYIDRHPGGWRKRLLQARVLRERGELADAAREYEDVVALRPRHVAAWLELAESLFAHHGPAAAAECHRRASIAAGGDAVPLFAALAEQHADTALNKLRALPSSPYISFLIAQRCLSAGRLEEAAAVLDAELDRDPGNVALQTASFDVLTLLDRQSAGPRPLQTAGTACVEALHARGLAARARGDIRRVEAIAETLRLQHPRSAAASTYYAELCGEELVIPALRHACRLDPLGSVPRVLLANALAASGHYDAARDLLIETAAHGDRALIDIVRLARPDGHLACVIAAAAARVLELNPGFDRAAALVHNA